MLTKIPALIAHANAFLNGGEPIPDWRTLDVFGAVEEFQMGLFWNRYPLTT